MANLIKIAEKKDLMPGQGGVFEVEGEKIVVFNIDGRFYAVEDKFNAAGGPSPTVSRATKYYTVKAAGNDIQLEL